jgi:hypothetical protein
MFGCNWQKYGTSPALVNLWLYVPPGFINGVKFGDESNTFPLLASLAPVPDTTVCGWLSLFVQVTVSPTFTLIGFGENAVSVLLDAPDVMDTLVPPAAVLPPAAAGDAVAFPVVALLDVVVFVPAAGAVVALLDVVLLGVAVIVALVVALLPDDAVTGLGVDVTPGGFTLAANGLPFGGTHVPAGWSFSVELLFAFTINAPPLST